MEDLISWLYSFLHKAIWILALIFIIYFAHEPLLKIMNNPEIFKEGNFYCLYYFVWILTVVLGFYFLAKIISNILAISDPIFIKEINDEITPQSDSDTSPR